MSDPNRYSMAPIHFAMREHCFCCSAPVDMSAARWPCDYCGSPCIPKETRLTLIPDEPRPSS